VAPTTVIAPATRTRARAATAGRLLQTRGRERRGRSFRLTGAVTRGERDAAQEGARGRNENP
jgi:hypothetical protein